MLKEEFNLVLKLTRFCIGLLNIVLEDPSISDFFKEFFKEI